MRMVTSIAFVAMTLSPPPQTPLQLAPFTSIESSNGAHVSLRYGPAQRVTMTRGDRAYSRISVTRGGMLVIDRCKEHCPRGYELEVEVIVPNVSSISVHDGGRIEARGTFPRQREIDIDVSNGGTVDLRPVVGDQVTASVNQGGRILTVAEASLVATVSHGGFIAYWGNARATSSISDGGVVTKGDPGDINTPFAEYSGSLP